MASKDSPRVYLVINPACSTCQKALKLLRDAGVGVDTREYLTEPLSEAELRDLHSKMDGVPAITMLRTKEAVFAETGLALDEPDDDKVLAALAKHPVLVQRPIAVFQGKAIVARPADTVMELVAPSGFGAATTGEVLQQFVAGVRDVFQPSDPAKEKEEDKKKQCTDQQC